MQRRSRYHHPVVEVLRDRKIRQVDLCRRLGYSQVYVSRALSGDYPAYMPFRRAVAEFLGLPAERLFHDDVTVWEARVNAAIASAPAEAQPRADLLAAALTSGRC